MSDIQFQSDQQNEFGRPPVYESAGVTGKMVTWGLAKNRKQAEYILLGVAVFIVIIAIWVFMSSGGGDAPPTLPE